MPCTAQDPNKWGGAIELSILSRHLGREIAAFDIQTTRVGGSGCSLGGDLAPVLPASACPKRSSSGRHWLLGVSTLTLGAHSPVHGFPRCLPQTSTVRVPGTASA